MEDFLVQIRSLIPGKWPQIEWLTGLVFVIAVFALGYICGILPSFLLNRRTNGVQERCVTLCKEILDKMREYDELYNRYVRELDSSKRTLLEGQINLVKENLKQLETKLAILEKRQPGKLPLRLLPVRQLKIE
jgi:hypothetical protein